MPDAFMNGTVGTSTIQGQLSKGQLKKMRGVAATILLLRGCVVRCFEEYLEMGTPWMARAGAPDAACAPAAPRPLPKSLRKRLAFFAFVTMDEPAMLAHWVAWYEALGVDLRSPARTRVWVHVPRGEAGAPRAKATMAVLARVAGVNATETYSSPVKQALANAFMDSLPRDALLVYPDSDEFFAYPCDVEAVVARDGAVHGHMVERIAANWEFRDVVAPGAGAPALPAQFPLQCRVTGRHLQANHFKQMLTPMVDRDGLRVRYRSSHNLYCVNLRSKDRRAKHCAPAGNRSYPFAHYRFTRRAYDLARRKRDVYGKILAGGETAETRVAARVFLFRRDAPGQAPAQVAARQDAEFLRAEKSLLNQTWAYVARGGAPGRAELKR